jgi:transposase
MQTPYINEMLDIPELQIHQILPMSADGIHIEVIPSNPKQCCPICRTDEFVTLKGSNGPRTVRHTPAFEKKNISWYPQFGCIARNVRQELFGI